MTTQYVVVDGSNIATEGRSLPSLRQLDEAVRAFLSEHPADQLTVVVDATFGHRIDASERAEYEAAVLAGELVSPPAGAIGRGDAFVLQIADKANAMILSNDSFQEFHGQYSWLFDEGRLMGGKPVPGLGWVFLLRTPVRGPASRRSVKEARTGRRAPADRSSDRNRGRSSRTSSKAKDATSPAPADSSGRSTKGRRAPAKPNEPLNDLLPFVDFVGAHPVGSEVEAEVESFSSHGAYAVVGDVRCYIPLKSMGDPPPARARDLLTIGETRRFTVASIDAPRRGIDLALVAGSAPVDLVTVPLPQGVPIGTVARQVHRRDPTKTPTSAVVTDTTSLVHDHAEEAPVTPVKKAAARKTAAKRAPAKKAAAKKAPAKKATAKKTVAKRAPAKKTTARKTTARKTTARKTAAKRAPAKKTAAKRAPAKKAPAKRTAAKKAPAKRTTARKAPARKAPAKRATAARKR